MTINETEQIQAKVKQLNHKPLEKFGEFKKKFPVILVYYFFFF